MPNHRIDISGRRYGKLVALRPGSLTHSGNYRWIFQCDCGNTVERAPTSVATSVRQNRRVACNECRSRNEYRIEGGVVRLDVSTPLHQNAICLIDIQDLDVTISTGGRWHAAMGPNGLLYVTQKNGGYLHRALLNPQRDREVDHINGSGLDNRRDNLRVVTSAENRRNTRVSSRNRTGVVGVCRKQGRYLATAVNMDGKKLEVGYFDTLEAAAAARKEAELLYGYHPNHGRAS